jgi:hypothetical protein
MIDNGTKNRAQITKMTTGVRVAFFLSLLTNAYDLYRFIMPGTPRQGLSIALGIVGTLLIWQLSRELRAEKKQAMYYWLALILLGYARWAFVDAAFRLSVFSIFLLGLAIMITFRMASWMRNGMLT